ncbi:MAG: phosphodiester glycosidase family protein [Candidatus Hydrogenedentes bacterium]|nr:phosphodiester glycosidase family protein [Candidatus Hydrogenedentota bacterium]
MAHMHWVRSSKSRIALNGARVARAVVCALFAALLGCTTIGASTGCVGPPLQRAHWRPAFEGVSLASFHRALPEPIAIWAARIDLRAPGIRFFVTPPLEPGASETSGMKTSTFLKRYGLQLAVNASAFDPVQENEGTPIRIVGLSVSEGVMYSPPSENYGALMIDRANRVTIAAPPVDASNAYNGVGGFGALLEHGENVGEEEEKRHPRTAAGVSRDGRYLYLLVLDGRQPLHSAGATTAETADWMKWLGAYDALNLDGGGSSAMVIADEAGGAKILNRPIHNGVPGTERVVGNHLGIFARPLHSR